MMTEQNQNEVDVAEEVNVSALEAVGDESLVELESAALDEVLVDDYLQEKANAIVEEIDLQTEKDTLREKYGFDYEWLCGAVETIVFMNDRPCSITRIRDLVDERLSLRIIHDAVLRLQNEYEASHHGIRLLEVAEGYHFRTKATFSKYVQDIFKVNSLVLSPTALEVLAIIAYKQPVSRVEVDKIRGVDSSHIIRTLMDKRLVKFVGRSEELGRPALYGTTLEFLEVFNLADLSQLPSEAELDSLTPTSVGKIGDIRELCAGDKTKFYFDEIEELDRLTSSIKTIDADTPFTKSLRIEDRKRITEEGHVAKSAFDILEDCLREQAIRTQNQEALRSEMLMPAVSPVVVNDLENAHLHNAPLKEEESFQMIDLETGAPIQVESALAVEPTTSMSEEELGVALDEAFERLMEAPSALKNINEIDDAELLASDAKIEAQSAAIGSITEQMIQHAENLDLDLSFMHEEKTEEVSEDKFI